MSNTQTKIVATTTPSGKRPKNWVVVRCRDGNKRAYNTPYWRHWVYQGRYDDPDEFWCAHCGDKVMRGHLKEHVCEDGSSLLR